MIYHRDSHELVGTFHYVEPINPSGRIPKPRVALVFPEYYTVFKLTEDEVIWHIALEKI